VVHGYDLRERRSGSKAARIKISSRRPVILTAFFRGFLQSFRAEKRNNRPAISQATTFSFYVYFPPKPLVTGHSVVTCFG
jgi:hypothetical protein